MNTATSCLDLGMRVTEFSVLAEPVQVALTRVGSSAAAAPRCKEQIRLAAVADILVAAEGVFAHAGFAGVTMAEIAERAGLPKANLHYYFRTKAALYREVLDHTLTLWLVETDGIHRDAHPATALRDYIRAKMRLAAAHPDASRVFANEMLHGAPQIGGYLRHELKALIDEKSKVIEHWADQGLMDRVDARHLFFTILASTQTYADFQPQVCAVLGKPKLTKSELERASDQLVRLILKGCGCVTRRESGRHWLVCHFERSEKPAFLQKSVKQISRCAQNDNYWLKRNYNTKLYIRRAQQGINA